MFDEERLSERQRQLVELSAKGATDKEIAVVLGIGEGTLRTYWDRLRLRLDAKSRTEAVAKIFQYRYDRLRSQQEDLQAILRHLPQFVWTAKPDGYVDYCNDWFNLYGGLSAEQCLGTGCRSLMPEEDLAESASRWQAAQESRQAYEAKVRFRCAGGIVRHHQIRLFPLRTPSGEVYKWVGTGQEVPSDLDDRFSLR